MLTRSAGATSDDMLRFAKLLADNRNVIFVWSMGVTQHAHGTDTVRALVNLALARGSIGREHAGLMPIRGHSGVQGGAEVGCVPNMFPGGRTGHRAKPPPRCRSTGASGFRRVAGSRPPSRSKPAHERRLDLLWAAGGNFLETLPEPDFVREALERIPFRVHQDIVATTQMLVPPGKWMLVLPARTRYEQEGGGTETSTEREIIFSPEMPGPRPPEARAEWEILADRRGDRLSRTRRADPFPRRRGDPRRDRADGPRVRRDRGARREGRSRPVGRPDPVSRRRVPDSRRPGAVRRRRSARAASSSRASSCSRRAAASSSTRWCNANRDPLTGAKRDNVLISAEDAAALGVREGEPLLVRSEVGELRGRAKLVADPAGQRSGALAGVAAPDPPGRSRPRVRHPRLQRRRRDREGRVRAMSDERDAGATVKATPLVIRDGDASPRSDVLAAEEPLEIRVNTHGVDHAISVTMRTPGNDFELAVGFLHDRRRDPRPRRRRSGSVLRRRPG